MKKMCTERASVARFARHNCTATYALRMKYIIVKVGDSILENIFDSPREKKRERKGERKMIAKA